MSWLDDHPPARSQFTCPRREQPSGVILLHTAESTPDFVAFDGGAEAVANFIRTRDDPGSYHDICDSDSTINLVGPSCEAYHDATGSNRHSYGISVATRADVWPLAPQAWRDGAVHQAATAAARYARWIKALYGITIPARRITRAQSEDRTPGFISHAERDPARRTDPGAGFPWNQFLDDYAEQMDTDNGGTFMAALTEAEQRELYKHVVGDGRLRETLLLARALAGADVGDLDVADLAAGGDARPALKTLVAGAVLDGLRPATPENPDRGGLRGPFKELLREVLDEAGLTPADPG